MMQVFSLKATTSWFSTVVTL